MLSLLLITCRVTAEGCNFGTILILIKILIINQSVLMSLFCTRNQNI